MEYAQRIKKLGLWTLEERRNLADLIEVYKMATGQSRLPLATFFQTATYKNTRGHSLKLHKNSMRTELRRHFFSERVVSRWNKLNEETVSAATLSSFKNGLKKLRDTRMGLFKDECPHGLGLRSGTSSRSYLSPDRVSYRVSYYLQTVRIKVGRRIMPRIMPPCVLGLFSKYW